MKDGHGKLIGCGHRVYQNYDRRTKTMKRTAALDTSRIRLANESHLNVRWVTANRWRWMRMNSNTLRRDVEKFMKTRSFLIATVTTGLFLCLSIPWLFY